MPKPHCIDVPSPASTEEAYAQELRRQQAAGEIHHWWYEAVKIRLAYDSCFLTVDFLVQLPDGTLEFRDCKGGPTEGDAAVKQKMLVELFPFRLFEVRKIPAKRGGGWDVKEISGSE